MTPMDLFLVIGKVTLANNADVLPKVRKRLGAASYDAETAYTIVQKPLPFLTWHRRSGTQVARGVRAAR